MRTRLLFVAHSCQVLLHEVLEGGDGGVLGGVRFVCKGKRPECRQQVQRKTVTYQQWTK